MLLSSQITHRGAIALRLPPLFDALLQRQMSLKKHKIRSALFVGRGLLQAATEEVDHLPTMGEEGDKCFPGRNLMDRPSPTKNMT